ncbi:MAG: hypothetical protein GWP61_13865 [Chloroflexi bacterium]|nr:hypothetical protein [Chloroflexota bacterium]
MSEAIFYQIFPDRFANGNPDTDPKADEYEYKGFGPKTFPWSTKPSHDQTFPTIFYGGDLPGINQKLNYLQRLGVNALYLNPIFTARSNHKYDVVDYGQVDPHLGGGDALVQLREDLNERACVISWMLFPIIVVTGIPGSSELFPIPIPQKQASLPSTSILTNMLPGWGSGPCPNSIIKVPNCGGASTKMKIHSFANGCFHHIRLMAGAWT